MNLILLRDTLAICRLEPEAVLPAWAAGSFIAIVRTAEEFSVVCAQEFVPADVHAERGWRCWRVAGRLEFSLVGVIAGLTTVLAEAGISVFVVSSYDTDFVLVREADLAKSNEVFERAGHKTVNCD